MGSGSGGLILLSPEDLRVMVPTLSILADTKKFILQCSYFECDESGKLNILSERTTVMLSS